jgi:hypothetical protein
LEAVQQVCPVGSLPVPPAHSDNNHIRPSSSRIVNYGQDLGVTAAAMALDEAVPTVEAVLNIIHRLTEPVIPTLKINDIPLNVLPPLQYVIKRGAKWNGMPVLTYLNN